MPTISIDIPDDLLHDVEVVIAKGSITLEEAILLSLARLASQQSSIEDETLNKLLEEGINSPSIVADEGFWDKHIAALKAKHEERSRRRTA